MRSLRSGRASVPPHDTPVTQPSLSLVTMEATEQVRVRLIIFCEPTIDVYLHFAPRVAVFFRANMPILTKYPILTNIFQLFPI